MGFGVRIAPGVRVRVSSRGVRTSVGPRVARVHVGAGRTGFSTGIGPFSYSTTVGSGSSSRSRGGSYGSYYQTGGSGTGRTNWEKANAAQEIQAALKLWTRAHLRSFKATERVIVPKPQPRNLDALFAEEKASALAGIGIFKLKERKAAKALALQKAQARKEQLERSDLEEARQQQEADDAYWALVEKCDPDTVFELITNAFGDNESKAALLDVSGTTADLMVLVPDISVLPEKEASVTAAGNLSVRAMSKSARNELYRELVLSQTLVSAKEAFAVVPALKHVRILTVRTSESDQNKFDCVGFGVFDRGKFLSKIDTNASASSIIDSVSAEWVENFYSKGRVAPIDLSREPDIKAVLAAVAEGDADYGVEAKEHLGVSVGDVGHLVEESQAKAKRNTSSSRSKSLSSQDDQDLAIKVAAFCLGKPQVELSEIQWASGLSEEMAAKMALFLTYAGVLKSTSDDSVFKVILAADKFGDIMSDIRMSISFRRL